MPRIVRTGSWIARNSSVPTAQLGRRGVNRKWLAGLTQVTSYFSVSMRLRKLNPPHPEPRTTARCFRTPGGGGPRFFRLNRDAKLNDRRPQNAAPVTSCLHLSILLFFGVVVFFSSFPPF
ncbi:hypothetical protein DIPPA_25107 [Diplonema papillatum]|nr:hypothetical protein DIPPA_25107 [Diplonema papillatum]